MNEYTDKDGYLGNKINFSLDEKTTPIKRTTKNVKWHMEYQILICSVLSFIYDDEMAT